MQQLNCRSTWTIRIRNDLETNTNDLETTVDDDDDDSTPKRPRVRRRRNASKVGHVNVLPYSWPPLPSRPLAWQHVGTDIPCPAATILGTWNHRVPVSAILLSFSTCVSPRLVRPEPIPHELVPLREKEKEKEKMKSDPFKYIYKDRREWSICSFQVSRGYSLNINWKQGTTLFFAFSVYNTNYELQH
jgi:hypothetical protein